MEALHRNSTWNITSFPKNGKPIGCRWIDKIKYKPNRELEHYKAHLVAKGYNQRDGIDFMETFSPLAKILTVHFVIYLSFHNSWLYISLTSMILFFMEIFLNMFI